MKLNPHRKEVADKELVKSIVSFCQVVLQSYFDQELEHDEEV